MYCVICVVFPLPVSPTTITTLFSRITCIRSSRAAKTGRNSRCSRMVFSFANALRATLGASATWLANFEPARKSASSPSSSSFTWSAPSSSVSPACFRARAACSAASSRSLRVVPVTSPIFVPFISQNRSRDLFSSRFSRVVCISAEPLRAMDAMSLVASFTGITVSALCVETPATPSRNGGLVSCTSNITRRSSSVSKSRSTSRTRTTPEVTSRFSSHALWSARTPCIFLLIASVIGRPSPRVRRFWYAASFLLLRSSSIPPRPPKGSARWSPPNPPPPPSSSSYHARSKSREEERNPPSSRSSPNPNEPPPPGRGPNPSSKSSRAADPFVGVSSSNASKETR